MTNEQLEEIKAQIVLYHLQSKITSGMDYFNFIQRLPKDKEILDFVCDFCPTFWCFLYAKKTGIYSLKLEDRICKESPELIIKWAFIFSAKDKLRNAVNASGDPSIIIEYAKTIDEKFIEETHQALVNLTSNGDPDNRRYLRLYCDYFEHYGK
jgi:hypothetical protein